MTFEQGAIIVLLVTMLAIFALDRFRMEVVALTGLAVGVLVGLVPPTEAFSGFANPAVITVIEILLIVQVLGRASLLDRLAARISAGIHGERSLLLILCGLTATVSVFMNNIGALALALPVVFSVCNMTAMNPKRVLIPVSFSALLGGLCSIIGTPANLLVSQALRAETGLGLGFFDFAYTGVPVAIVSILVLVAWSPLALGSGQEVKKLGRMPIPRRVVAEMVIPMGSCIVGTTIGDVPARLPATLHAAVRDGQNLFLGRRSTELRAGDILLLEMELADFERAIAGGISACSLR